MEWHQGRPASWLARRVARQLADWQSTMSAIHFALDAKSCKKNAGY
jgi:hypothetical protein